MTTTTATISSIETWLQASSDATPLAEIEILRGHLQTLGERPLPAPLLQRLMGGLHARAQSAIEMLLPKLYGIRLPISQNTRQAVRTMQEALETLTRLSLTLVEAPDSQWVESLGTPPEVALWRIFHAIGRQMALADLTASPYPPGAWFNLHRTYLAARRYRVENSIPFGAQYDLQSLYARTLLLGALPSSALTAQEWGYAHRLMLRLAMSLQVLDTQPGNGFGTLLWVAPEKDSPPVHFERKPAPEQILVVFIQYQELLKELSRLLNAVSTENTSGRALPDDVSPKTARITLRRLLDHLDSPKKRRFPRRRQGYRTILCFGFADIFQLLKTGIVEGIDLSEWMVVNESPGGYAAMHVAGRPHKVQVGDLIGLRRDGEENWRICIVRWALSENQEHLELGLQEISPRARPGHIATPGQQGTSEQQAALLFPAVLPLRTLDAIAFAPGNRPNAGNKHLLVLAGNGVEIREFALESAIEQSADADIFLIESNLPA